jgi:hypothetical protein
MKIFYTASDIEELAARGITQLELGPGVAVTDVGRERAEELRIKLVTADAPQAAAKPAAASAGAPAAAKPRGCQHGPLPGLGEPVSSVAAAQAAGKPAGSDGVVGRLVNIVSKLADRGG